MILRTRWAAFAVLPLFVVRSGEAQDNDGNSTGELGPSPTPASVSLAPTVLTTRPPLGQPTPKPTDPMMEPTPGPTTPSTDGTLDDDDGSPTNDGQAITDGDTTEEDDDDGAVIAISDASDSEWCENYEGTAGTNTDGDTPVCCADFCGDTCAQDDDCEDRGGADTCCPDTIVLSTTVCGIDNAVAPCILAPTPAPTPAPRSAEPGQTEDSSEGVEDDDLSSTEDTAVGAIAGGVVAGVLVVGAVIVAVLFKTGRLNFCRGSSSKTSADDITPAPPSGPVPAGNGRLQAIQGHSSQHPGPAQYPVAFQYPEAL